MSDHYSPSPSIVVGVDGSRAAIDAALWAVDEAVSRDIPLRLTYAIDPATTDADPQTAARELAKAEVAVRYACMAVESTDAPVKIEVEIMQERPTRALLDATRWAAMVCVGSMGLKHCLHGRMGSTAAALALSAHCPVAVVRGHDPFGPAGQWVVVELDASPASEGVLRRALDEAQLRAAPLRVLNGNRLAGAQLHRRLATWKKHYPDVDLDTVDAHGSTVNFLTEKANSIQLLVVGHERSHGIGALVGPPGYAALHNANCSVLICEPQNVL